MKWELNCAHTINLSVTGVIMELVSLAEQSTGGLGYGCCGLNDHEREVSVAFLGMLNRELLTSIL